MIPCALENLLEGSKKGSETRLKNLALRVGDEGGAVSRNERICTTYGTALSLFALPSSRPLPDYVHGRPLSLGISRPPFFAPYSVP